MPESFHERVENWLAIFCSCLEEFKTKGSVAKAEDYLTKLKLMNNPDAIFCTLKMLG